MGEDAKNIYVDASTKDKLAQTYAELQGYIATTALSMQLKNTNIEGTPTRGGSVVARRLATSIVRDYGTARSQGKGDHLTNKGVTINIDTDKEIVEEVEMKDAKLYGIPDILNKRVGVHKLAMVNFLDSLYFQKLQDEATIVTSSASTTVDKLLELIQDLEDTQNENVDRVPRELMALTLSPKWYDEVVKYMNTLPNPNGQDYKTLHNVRVYSAPRQGFDAIIQVVGSVAQPVAVVNAYDVERIPLSNALAVELFFSVGTKAVMPDLIKAMALDSDISA